MRTGRLLVLSGPSGAGKDIVGELVTTQSSFVRLPTYTTRAPRAGEIEGVHYHFVSADTFQSLVARGDLFDPVGVHDLYGIPLASLITALEQGQDVLMHLAAASAFRLKHVVPEAMVVKIQPASEAELESRLLHRGMTQDQIARRRENEPEHNPTSCVYDLVVVNENGACQKTATDILDYLAQFK